jgi:hypothetical protein
VPVLALEQGHVYKKGCLVLEKGVSHNMRVPLFVHEQSLYPFALTEYELLVSSNQFLQRFSISVIIKKKNKAPVNQYPNL